MVDDAHGQCQNSAALMMLVRKIRPKAGSLRNPAEELFFRWDLCQGGGEVAGPEISDWAKFCSHAFLWIESVGWGDRPPSGTGPSGRQPK